MIISRPSCLRIIHHVDFDVKDLNHLEACKSLIIDERQHNSRRFNLELPFGSVRDMVLYKLAEQHLAEKLGEPAIENNNDTTNNDFAVGIHSRVSQTA